MSISAPTSGELAAKARRAVSSGADLVEFRVDRVVRPDFSELKRDLGPFVEEAIVTVRRPDEGGAFRGPEPERLKLIEELADLSPGYLDVELRTLKSSRRLAVANLGRKIVSWHSTKGTPNKSLLVSLMSEASGFGGIPKIVPTAVEAEDNLRVLSLYDMSGPVPIAFCTGASGVFSRVMAVGRGTPIVYASLEGEPTAEGQFSLGQALAVRRRLQND